MSISSSSGAYSTTSTSYVDVTNLSVSFTSTGRPLLIQISGYSIRLSNPASTSDNVTAYIKLVKDSTDVAVWSIYVGQEDTSMVPNASTIYTPSAGTYTFKIQAKTDNSNNELFISQCTLQVVEL